MQSAVLSKKYNLPGEKSYNSGVGDSKIIEQVR